MNIDKYQDSITNVSDFPIKGIQFKDITTLFENPDAFKAMMDDLIEQIDHLPEFNKIVALDARGFVLGGPLALHYHVPLVLARKPGKLPREGVKQSYSLEYGQNTMCISQNSIIKGDKVLVVDDLLATGGTINSIVKITEKCDATCVGAAVIIELDDLNGRELLKPIDVVSLLHYKGE